MTALVACPHCRQHCRIDEAVCPHCQGRIRSVDGRIERTAAAILLGLTVVGAGAGSAGCTPKYGGPPAPPVEESSEAPTGAQGVAASASVAPTAESTAGPAAPSPTSEGSAPAPPADVYGVPAAPEGPTKRRSPSPLEPSEP